jgi:putative two-component system response regulator
MPNSITVLVVDGDAHNLMTLSALLKALDIRYKRNTTGTKVLEQAHAMLPRLDAILLDMSLPDADAYAICAELKSDPLLSKIPVIAMTHQRTVELLQAVRKSGFAGLVERPFPRNHFDVYLRRIISERAAGNGSH